MLKQLTLTLSLLTLTLSVANAAPVKLEACQKAYKSTPTSQQIVDYARSVTPELFNYEQLAVDPNHLKPCFTESGWDSYTKALNQSGNLKLTKENQLKTTLNVIDNPKIGINAKKNWSVTTELNIHFANQDKEASQKLFARLLLSYQGNQLLIEQVDAKAMDNANNKESNNN
jgi:hypothetical protein